MSGNLNTSRSLYGWTQLVYALHALSVGIAILGSAIGILASTTGVGTSLIRMAGPGVLAAHGLPSIIAVIVNYTKRSDVAGTWLASHFRWQLRTFWFAAVFAAIYSSFVILTVGTGRIIFWVPSGFLGLWFVYRIARGWLALRDQRPMYA